jgi:hypothetical protein
VRSVGLICNWLTRLSLIFKPASVVSFKGNMNLFVPQFACEKDRRFFQIPRDIFTQAVVLSLLMNSRHHLIVISKIVHPNL